MSLLSYRVFEEVRMKRNLLDMRHLERGREHGRQPGAAAPPWD
jgi:hypothetical protein